MRLFHGSLYVVETPRILEVSPVRHLDFGSGFYTTTSLEQATRWVKIRLESNRDFSQGYVSFYDVSDDLLNNPKFKTLVFPEANSEWLNFVVSNRRDAGFVHDYDLVAGPVANDRVYASVTLYENGFIDEQETIKRLKTYKLVDQILFHSIKSISELKYVGCEVVK